MKHLLQIVVFALFVNGQVSAAIEEIIIDEVNGNTNYPRPLYGATGDVTFKATNGNWNNNNFGNKLPVQAGNNYKIIVIGDWMDTWDRMELKQSDGVTDAKNVSISNKVKSVVGGKGRTTFTLTLDNQFKEGNTFVIRFRYLVEVNSGFMSGENIAFEAVAKPVITNVSIDPQPVREGSTLYLRKNVTYTLTFTVANIQGCMIYYTGGDFISTLTGGGIMKMKYLTSNSFANPFISACNGFFLSPGNTFKMQIKAYENDSRNECNLLDLHNLLFKFIDGNVDEPFRKFQSLHVSAKIGNLSNVAPNTNLSSVFAGEKLPDIVPAKLENVTRGTTFKFENVTVTDALGNIYKALAVDQNNTNDLGHQLTNLNLGSNSSRLVTKSMGSDPTLGQIELMEISMGTYVLPIANIGTADAKIPFTNRFTGNMVTGSIKLPTKEDLKQKIAFPFTSTFDYVLPSLATGITNNCVVNKANIQVFTFSNRPFKFYCDNRWPVESQVELNVDFYNTIDELEDGINFNYRKY